MWKEKTTGRLWYGGSIMLAGRRVFNPTEKQLEAAGYERFTPLVHEPGLEDIRLQKLAEIDSYDTSPAVNSFTLNGATVWLDKATRVGLMNSLNCEKAAGRDTTTLWLGTTPITLNVERAMQLLSAVELYALECFGVTASHKAAVEALDTIEAVEAYDYTAGYPDKLDINTTNE